MLIKHFPKSQFLGFHIKLFVTLKLLEREWKNQLTNSSSQQITT